VPGRESRGVWRSAGEISDTGSSLGSLAKTMSAQSVHTQPRICATGQKRRSPGRVTTSVRLSRRDGETSDSC